MMRMRAGAWLLGFLLLLSLVMAGCATMPTATHRSAGIVAPDRQVVHLGLSMPVLGVRGDLDCPSMGPCHFMFDVHPEVGFRLSAGERHEHTLRYGTGLLALNYFGYEYAHLIRPPGSAWNLTAFAGGNVGHIHLYAAWFVAPTVGAVMGRTQGWLRPELAMKLMGQLGYPWGHWDWGQRRGFWITSATVEPRLRLAFERVELYVGGVLFTGAWDCSFCSAQPVNGALVRYRGGGPSVGLTFKLD